MHIKIFLFEYLPNPVIQNITPRATILKGGIIQTIRGYHFDTVSNHQMVIYLKEFNGTNTTVTTDCTLVSGEEIHCLTPDLTLQVKQTINKTGSGFVSQTDEDDLNEDRISFALGIIFGQLDFYEELENNIYSHLKSLAQLHVYEDPFIYTFMDEYNQSYQEVNSDELVIMFGENLNKGAAQKDYIVEVGQSYCNVTGLSTHQLVCRLLAKEPAVLEGNTIEVKNKDLPHVKVMVGNLKTDVGYLYYLNRIWYDNDPFRHSMIGLTTTFVLASIAVAIFSVVKTCKQKKILAALTMKKADSSELGTKRSGNESVRHWFLKQKLDENVQTNLDRCKISNEKLSIGKQIGKGNFGMVYKGQLITPSGNLKTVAVKTLKDDQELSFDDFESFLIEGTMMIDFKHKNVLSLIGVVCEEGERPMVVLPYMENGDLCSLVKREDLELILSDILHFGLQIANGMSYLAKERFVHRDLATRNCMVNGSFIVKISDFGMSRDIYEKDYYSMKALNKPVPLKWMAVESLKEGRYSSKSDVWSYGITVWELLTRGGSPYPGVSNYHIKEYVTSGMRLDKPSSCPPRIFKEICKCWEEEPERQPTFDDLSDYLTKVLRGKIIPSAGSEQTENYYCDRSVTKNIPEDYLDMTDVDESEEYLQPIKTQTPLNSVSLWSYGITVWELLTHGSSPYPGVSNYHIKEYVTSGKRLDKPSTCPPGIKVFLNITALNQSGSEIVYMEINSTHSYTVGPAIEKSYELLLLGEFVILLMSKGWAVFSEGELARTVGILSNSTVDEIKVGFGSDDFIGEVTNIQMHVHNSYRFQSAIFYVFWRTTRQVPVSTRMWMPF
ncbi:hepatocyte growth factor receptor-like [Watersipora subatra]|uniref:hepatocyte growth factor receptor-like n=1 Tax=Watersipora subatra TaxID=2589382 RepID=UPI00355C6DA4